MRRARGGGSDAAIFVCGSASLAPICGGRDTLIFWVRRDFCSGGLVFLQLAETAVDGAFEVAFVAGQFGEGVGGGAIGVEGTRQKVACIRHGGLRRRFFAVLVGIRFSLGVEAGAGLVVAVDIVETVAIDAGFEGHGAVEAPLGQGDVGYELLFRGSFGMEAGEVVAQEGGEFGGVVRGEKVQIRGCRGGCSWLLRIVHCDISASRLGGHAAGIYGSRLEETDGAGEMILAAGLLGVEVRF